MLNFSRLCQCLRKVDSSLCSSLLFRTFSTDLQMTQSLHDMKRDRIVWVDLEMSGLDFNKEHILEMACLITDSDLNIIAETDDIVINQPHAVLDNMDEWCKTHHGQSGLTQAVFNSKISLQDAEKTMVEFIKQHTIKHSAPLAGNSVHMDKMFLMKYMPNFIEHLHYRLVDVSTIKELCKRWYPEKLKGAPSKQLTHRALDDIKESIEELKFYKRTVFIKPD